MLLTVVWRVLLFSTCVLHMTRFAVADDADDAPQHEHHPADSEHVGGAMLGPYAMSREGTGTSWQPDSTPMDAVHFEGGAFAFMLHGFADVGFQDEPIPRGGNEAFSTSMFMFNGVRALGAGRFGFRFMTSLEPTMGGSGYPLLFQTGETADGVTPLVDRQHPHDVMMEIAATYSFDVARDSSVFVYVAPVGEPAIGPPAFMHRASSGDNPLAPISHHWLDSTHISYGVVTAGVNVGSRAKVETSAFNGHEPDERRWDVEPFALNSYSARVTVSPSTNWTLQGSFADLSEPESLHPNIDVRRLTFSGTYNRPLTAGNWQTTVAWGLNTKSAAPAAIDLSGLFHVHPGQSIGSGVSTPKLSQSALLAESALRFGGKSTLFGRYERAEKDELFEPSDPRHNVVFNVNKINVGYSYDLLGSRPLALAGGVAVGVHLLPRELSLTYGKSPMTLTFFMRLKIR